MDSKKAEALREKYWEGKTSLEEETELKRYFSTGSFSNEPEKAYFDFLHNKGALNPLDEEFDNDILNLINEKNNEIKTKKSILNYWYIAASVVLVISISIIFRTEITRVEKPINMVQIDTYDDPAKAFEETKRALLLISSRLNQTNDYTSQFSKFEESQKKLKKN